MIFYTTKIQEQQLDSKFNYKIQLKQAEIEKIEKDTGKIQKYTAYAYIKREPRVFYFENSQLYLEIHGEKFPHSNVVPKKNDLGRVYKVDYSFDSKIRQFISEHNSWKIIFFPHKIEGLFMYYTDNSVMPAKLLTLDESDELVLEDNSKYVF